MSEQEDKGKKQKEVAVEAAGEEVQTDGQGEASDTDTVADTPTESGVELPVCYGIKAGMTRVFDDGGNHVPVTVIKLIPNYISQVKTQASDGHDAYQLSFGEKREKLINRPQTGILRKAGIQQNFSRFAEVAAPGGAEVDNLGKEVNVSFSKGSYVDICGASKGKGFQGVIKKFGFRGGPASHGSKFHRTGGSIGNRATPGRVWKNKKMPGHLGAATHTVQNLQVVDTNEEQGYLLVKGAIPGAKNNFVKIGKAVKKQGKGES